MTAALIAGGLALIVLALLWVANDKARESQARADMPRYLARKRVHDAWADFVHQHQREPSMPELIGALYPDDGVEGADANPGLHDGPPPPTEET